MTDSQKLITQIDGAIFIADFWFITLLVSRVFKNNFRLINSVIVINNILIKRLSF